MQLIFLGRRERNKNANSLYRKELGVFRLVLWIVLVRLIVADDVMITEPTAQIDLPAALGTERIKVRCLVLGLALCLVLGG